MTTDADVAARLARVEGETTIILRAMQRLPEQYVAADRFEDLARVLEKRLDRLELIMVTVAGSVILTLLGALGTLLKGALRL